MKLDILIAIMYFFGIIQMFISSSECWLTMLGESGSYQTIWKKKKEMRDNWWPAHMVTVTLDESQFELLNEKPSNYGRRATLVNSTPHPSHQMQTHTHTHTNYPIVFKSPYSTSTDVLRLKHCPSQKFISYLFSIWNFQLPTSRIKVWTVRNNKWWVRR